MVSREFITIRKPLTKVYNLTIHSHLYRILTPSGSNFLDFGSVIINAPTIRTVYFQNLTFSPLLLELMASQPEDVELFVKAEDAPAVVKSGPGKYAETTAGPERAISPPNGELKERFMETMRELSVKADGPPAKTKAVKAKGTKVKEKNEQAGDEMPKLSIGASMMVALKKGGRGKPVQVSCPLQGVSGANESCMGTPWCTRTETCWKTTNTLISLLDHLSPRIVRVLARKGQHCWTQSSLKTSRSCRDSILGSRNSTLLLQPEPSASSAKTPE